MKRLVGAATALFILLSGAGTAARDAPTALSSDPMDVESPVPLVVGGASTLNPGYVAALLLANVADPGLAQFCGGSLIRSDVVLTAAHCVETLSPGELEIAVGQTYLSDIGPSDRISVTEIAIHPGWTGVLTTVDLALLRLATAAPVAELVPPETDVAEPTLGRPLIVVGWGFIDPFRTTLPDPMQAATVLTATDTTTSAGAANLLCLLDDPGDDFCFGGETTGACNGDSGGPLLGETSTGSGVFEVVGVVSFGSMISRP